MIYKGVDYSKGDRPIDRRRVPPEMKKTWQVSRVWDLHEEIKRRVILGQKNTVIAKAVGCTKETVSNVKNSPIIQDQLAVMRGARDAYTIDIAKEIQEFAPEALKLLKDIVNGKGVGANASPALRAKEANNFMDRAGHAVVRNVNVSGTHALLTLDDIDEIKRRAFLSHNPVVDAEYTETNVGECNEQNAPTK
jgi:hypothetical protein